jgi:hypothetical protein
LQLRAQHSSNTSDVRKDGEREQQYRCTSKRSRIANGRRPRAAAHGGSRGTCTRESAQEHQTTTSHHQLSSSQSRPVDRRRERGQKAPHPPDARIPAAPAPRAGRHPTTSTCPWRPHPIRPPSPPPPSRAASTIFTNPPFFPAVFLNRRVCVLLCFIRRVL